VRRRGSVEPVDEAAGLALDAALELEVDQFGRDIGGGQGEIADQLILGQRARAEPVEDLPVQIADLLGAAGLRRGRGNAV